MAMDLLDQSADRADRHHHGDDAASRKVSAPSAALDIPGLALVAVPHSRWSGACCAATPPAGAAPRSLTALVARPAAGGWPLSSGNCTPPRRWCRCGCSGRGHFHRESSPAFSCTGRCTACCFCCRSSCRPRSATVPLGTGLRLLPWTATLFVTAPIARRRRQQDRRAPAGRGRAPDAGNRPRLDRNDHDARRRLRRR